MRVMRDLFGRICYGMLALCLACGGPEDSKKPGDATPGASADGGSAERGGDPERGDWLVIRIGSDPENLNPITSSDATATDVLRWIFPALTRLDNDTLEQRSLLAGLPEISEDKLSYTYKLRPDITFADGKPLTAADVVFTMKLIKHPGVRAPHQRNYYESVRDAIAVDAYTVRFDLREKYFRNDLMLGGIQPMPKHYYDPESLLDDVTIPELDALAKDEKPKAADSAKLERAERFAQQFNEGFQRRAMGPGAFELRNPEQDVQTGSQIVLRRRASFWAPNESIYGDAWVDRVVFRIVNDPEAALVSFKGGNVDTLDLNPLQHRRPDTNNDKFKAQARKQEHIAAGYTYIGWNQKRALFQDVKVRRALSHLADRDNIIKNVLLGLGEPVESPVYKRRPEYNSSLPKYAYDPALARKLLAEAGWADSDGDGVLDKTIEGKKTPLAFEIITNSGNEVRKSVGLAVIDEMKRVGINASFRTLDWSIMLEKVKEFQFDAVILGWRMGSTAPDLFQIWHSSQAVPGASNHIAYVNKKVDELLETYRGEFDPDKRKALYDQVQQIIYDEQPYTFLYMPLEVTAWDDRFNGVRWYKTGGTDPNEWWVATAEQKYKSEAAQ